MAFAELLNCSRMLVDTREVARKSIIYISDETVPYEMSDKERSTFEAAASVFKQVICKRKAKKAIKSTFSQLSSNGCQITDEKLRSILNLYKKIPMKVLFTKKKNNGPSWFSMAGIGCIYIDADMVFSKISVESCKVARLVGMFFHCGTHYVQRLLASDF